MKDDDFDILMRRKREMDTKRSQVKSQASKQKLCEAVEKRIKTSFISALSSMETHLSCLWEDGDNSPRTSTQEELYQIYQTIRKEVFDKGHQQIRELKGDLVNFEVNFKQYQLDLNFKGEEGNE